MDVQAQRRWIWSGAVERLPVARSSLGLGLAASPVPENRTPIPRATCEEAIGRWLARTTLGQIANRAAKASDLGAPVGPHGPCLPHPLR